MTSKNTLKRTLGGTALIAGLLLGATACGGNSNPPAAEPTASAAATVAPEKNSAGEVSTAIKGFFAAATSEKIAAAFPDKVTEETFAPVLERVDVSAPAAPLKKAVTDLALLKVSDPKAALAVTVDEAKVVIDGVSASVPASAISVTSGKSAVSNSAALSAEMGHLVFRDGVWLVTFPEAPSASATPSVSASKK